MEATKVSHKKKLLVPKLRFRGFTQSWNVKMLSELLEFKNGINANKEQFGKGIKFINVLDILNNEFITYDLIIGSVDVEESVVSKYQVSYGDILFQRSSETREEVGTASVYLDPNKTATFGGFVIRGRKIGEYNPIFLNKLLKTGLSRSEITSKSGGSTRYNVGQETLSSVALPFPTLPEQQKIAAFLSAIDEKVKQLIRKKELLEQYKKGLMQKLFSGKLRFKDEKGNAFPKWEEKRLGEVSTIYDGTHQTPTYVKEGIPFYSVEHVTANQFSDTKYISKEVFEKENEKVRLEKGDILMTKIGDIGTARLIDWDVEASFYVSLALLKQSKLISPIYLNQYISSRNFQLELWKRIIHVAFPKKINLGEIGNCKVFVPIIKEQNKIANYLSGIDTKIEMVKSQIIQTQTFKKGLLQQMFV